MTTPAELRAQIDVKGAEISLIADEIEARFQEMKNWHYNVEQAPLLSVGVALGTGLMVSGVGVPLVRMLARQANAAIKASVTAYLTTLFTQKLRQIAER